MTNTRTGNTIKNITFGLLNRFVNIIFPFIVRSVLIYSLGAEYLGLNTLFSSILQILNLTELGLSSAIVYSMYKPIAENDTNMVCALLSLYRKLYKIIGVVVLGIGLILIPFLPNLINGGYPSEINLTVIYVVYLLNTVISYLFFAYKSAIWNACQQVSMVNNISSVVIALQSIAQVIILLTVQDYYVYLIVMPLCTFLNNIILSYLTGKHYPQYVCRGRISKKIEYSIEQRVKGLVITRVCTITRNSLDSVFISSMIGLTAVAIYGNYYYIMSAVFSVTSIIISSMTSSVGNSIVTESIEKNYSDMRKFNFSFAWIVGICTICLLCLYQPFMKHWVGEKMMYGMSMVILFCVYFYSLCLGSVRSAYHDAAGLWWEARYRAIAETVMNCALNYVLTMLLGVRGTVLSTILSILIINYGYGTSIVFKYYFKGISMKQYYIDHLYYTVVTFAAAFVTYGICVFLPVENPFVILILRLLVCVSVPNVIFLTAYHKNKLFIENIEIIKHLASQLNKMGKH